MNEASLAGLIVPSLIFLINDSDMAAQPPEQSRDNMGITRLRT